MKAPRNFWEGKEPCWEMVECARCLRDKCVAWLRPETPCWEHPATQCGRLLGIEPDCHRCRVFARYGAAAVFPVDSRRGV